MADPLSIAAGAIQTADAGFKLYGALSQYIRDYVDANKHVSRIADEVRTTSWALQQLGELLKEDDDIKLCRPEAIVETDAALTGCRKAFEEVDEILKEFLPPSSVAGDAYLTRGISRRWKWPLKKAKAQLLLAQLERLKTTILLVFKVLSYASKLASRPLRNDVELMDEKTQLHFLLKAKNEAVKTEARLLAVETGKSNTVMCKAGESDSCREHDNYPEMLPNETRGVAFSAYKIPAAGLSSVSRLSARKRRLVDQLSNCAAAATRLALTLERARDDLHLDADPEMYHVTKCFRVTKRAIDELILTELEADSEDGMSNVGLPRSTSLKQRRPRSASRDQTPPRSQPPQVSSVGRASTTAQMAGVQSLEQEPVPPETVIARSEHDIGLEAGAVPFAVQEKGESENKLRSRYPKNLAAGQSTLTSDSKSPDMGASDEGIMGMAAGGLEAVSATTAGYAYSGSYRDVQAMGKAPAFALPQSVQGSVNNMNAQNTTAPPVLPYSSVDAFQAPDMTVEVSAMTRRPPSSGYHASRGSAQAGDPSSLTRPVQSPPESILLSPATASSLSRPSSFSKTTPLGGGGTSVDGQSKGRKHFTVPSSMRNAVKALTRLKPPKSNALTFTGRATERRTFSDAAEEVKEDTELSSTDQAVAWAGGSRSSDVHIGDLSSDGQVHFNPFLSTSDSGASQLCSARGDVLPWFFETQGFDATRMGETCAYENDTSEEDSGEADVVNDLIMKWSTVKL
ncbi:hypothetical protein LTR17_021967 [Elasticomyces elasticus]|nr:hypothetical protein LTR17_021967 [Elasticomyces elasticus]